MKHKQPLEVAILKGATKKHPDRYRGTVPKSPFALGAAPDHLTDGAKRAWFELESLAIEGVLTGSDRFVMEIASSLVSQFRADPVEFPAAKIGHMIGCLARLGLTPADRQRLGVSNDTAGNPFDAF